MDLLDLFERGSAWTSEKVAGAKDNLEAQTPCKSWKVRDVVNHLIQGNEFFQASARGEQAPLDDPPPDVIGDGPSDIYDRARKATTAVFSGEGVIDKTGPKLGIAFVDQLVHGWDIAEATGQDTMMPDDLAQAAFGMVDGRLTDEQRGKFFGPEVKVPETASAQEKLLGYVGRTP
ncbi:MAG TPA: TIGR03086 family metal-binding protein [Actinomycetota bacterium]|jgi:uncharacterized protein (TIGR03086 family)|nr:TIGR03086 family metal-binding protein [Actinomycetota bacterium]